MEKLELSIFDLSPIPMWIQDYSGVKKIFEAWIAQGVTDLREYLLEQPSRLLPCLPTIQTTRINQSTLRLYEAENLQEILDNFAKFHFEEVSPEQINFFIGLWEKSQECTFTAINYTCTGRQIDVQLRANILPDHKESWDQILLTTEDISTSQNARRFAESLFLNSPTAIWVKDYSGLKCLYDQLKDQGVIDLENYIQQNPKFISLCFEHIHSLRVNQALLNLFQVKDEEHFNQNIKKIFRVSSQQNFYSQLLHLWEGRLQQKYECEYQTITGDSVYVHEQLVVFPDSQHNWDTVQIAFTDITERKRLENHLLYVNKHDQLTKLYNRTFFNYEIQRIQSNTIKPVSCIYLDINGLKKLNDARGHHYGDLLLIKFANILKKAITNSTYSASRIGGDEFVILMPHTKLEKAKKLLELIQELIASENKLSPTLNISFSAGVASTDENTDIHALIQLTDHIMYEQKKLYYSSPS